MRELFAAALIICSLLIVAYAGTAMPNGATLLALLCFGLGIYLVTATKPRN